ncbi:MAG: hypothetical protein PVI79_02345 [Gammaproteobacteria bacterium]|jgi:hypothetical protein
MGEVISFPVVPGKQIEENINVLLENIVHDHPGVQELWRQLVREYFEKQIEISAYSIEVNLSGSFTESEMEINSEAVRDAIRQYEVNVLAPINVEVIQLIRQIAELRAGR